MDVNAVLRIDYSQAKLLNLPGYYIQQPPQNLHIFSYGNQVTFLCDQTRPQKCYQIKGRNIFSENNLYNMKPS